MKNCPTCKTKYSTNVFYCPLEGSKLEDDVEVGPSKSVIGTILDDRYRIVSKLGEGGMGAVYMVEHVILKKQMAVKILRDEFARKEDLVKRFQMEAVAASRIGQENIVDVTDFGRTGDGNVFFVMEVLDGPNLGQAIKQETGIPVDRAVPILIQVCRALHAAHKQGIIHRDLKPENIHLIRRGDNADFVKILDFGISKMIDTTEGRTEKLTALGMIVGTPEYMSPEQASGAQIDLRTDIYSVGIIMYEMITGRLPFVADNALRILVMHQTEQAVPPRAVRPDLDIPAALEGIVLRAMAKKRDERQSSMEELMNELLGLQAMWRPAYEPRRTMAWDSAVGALPGINLSGVSPVGARRPSKTEAIDSAQMQAVVAPQAATPAPRSPTPVAHFQVAAPAQAPRSPTGPQQAALAGVRTPAAQRAVPFVEPSSSELQCEEDATGVVYCEPAENALARDVRDEMASAPAPQAEIGRVGATPWQERTDEIMPTGDVTVVAPSPYAAQAAAATARSVTPAPSHSRAPAPDPFDDVEPPPKAKSAMPVIIAVIVAVVLIGGAAAAYFTGMLGGGKPAQPVMTPPKPPAVPVAKAEEPKKEEPAVDPKKAEEPAQAGDGEPEVVGHAAKKGPKKDKVASAAPAAGEVSIDVDSSPPTVEVYRGQNFVGITPARIRGKKGEEELVTFKKDGYLAQTLPVRFDRPKPMRVELKSSGAKAAPPPSKRKDDLFDKIDDIKNPFK